MNKPERECYGSRECQEIGIKDGPASRSTAHCAGAAAPLWRAALTAHARPAWSPWSCFSRPGDAASFRDERCRGRPLGVAAGAQLRVWVQCAQDPPPVLLLLRKWLPGPPGTGRVAASVLGQPAVDIGVSSWPPEGRIQPAEASRLGCSVF